MRQNRYMAESHPSKETTMSNADQKRVAEIQEILNVDEETATATLNTIEDYFDPNWSEMTDRQFRNIVDAAFEFIGENL